MHAYLSSFSIGNRGHELIRLVHTPKAAIVANALDHALDGQLRHTFAHSQIDELGKLGFETQELDLRDYFGEPAALSRQLSDVGLVWVTGGNTFLLRRAMRQSGFDVWIQERRQIDGFVYGGFSAGACVAAPTLRGLNLVDTLEASARGYSDEIIWDGLGLVPFSIAPHFESDHPESALVSTMVQHFVNHDMPFITLRDGEAIISPVSR